MNNTSNIGVFSMVERIVLSTWYGLTGLAAIFGNGVVLWSVARNRSLRTIPNLFLTSFAAADFLVGLVIDPVWISIRHMATTEDDGQTSYGEAMDYLWIHTTVATTFNLCCVTLDRHIAIFYPLRYEAIVTHRRCYALIATVWLISLVFPCSRLLVDQTGLSTLWLSITIITVLIPMMIIVVCSIRNLKAAAVQSKNITHYSLPKADAVNRRKKNLKAVKTVSIVVGLFVVCWLPSLVTSILHYFNKRNTWSKVWAPVEAVAFTSSAINPWVYCLRNEEFYESLTRTFRFLRR